MKDLGQVIMILEIEITRSEKGTSLSMRASLTVIDVKYVLISPEKLAH